MFPRREFGSRLRRLAIVPFVTIISSTTFCLRHRFSICISSRGGSLYLNGSRERIGEFDSNRSTGFIASCIGHSQLIRAHHQAGRRIAVEFGITPFVIKRGFAACDLYRECSRGFTRTLRTGFFSDDHC